MNVITAKSLKSFIISENAVKTAVHQARVVYIVKVHNACAGQQSGAAAGDDGKRCRPYGAAVIIEFGDNASQGAAAEGFLGGCAP